MKPKFHPGDRVTVIKPYVAPVPDYVKDSEIFNDLYKAFGLDKDIRGVKPGDTYTIIEAESKPRTRSDGKTVYAYSYQGKSGKRSGNTVCCMVYTSSFDDESAFKGFAKPFDHDPFNEWIGKCVAACKAMGEPIPSFITHKNTKQDAA